MRIMGLDYGSKTVGVAVSDELLVTAQGVETILRKSPNKLRQTLARIEELVVEYGVGRIVLGYPKHMDNTEGERCERTKEFQALLERRCGLPVVLWDERLTTVAADRALEEGGVRREDRKQHVDRLAATLILQGYLDFHANQAAQDAGAAQAGQVAQTEETMQGAGAAQAGQWTQADRAEQEAWQARAAWTGQEAQSARAIQGRREAQDAIKE